MAYRASSAHGFRVGLGPQVFMGFIMLVGLTGLIGLAAGFRV